LSNDLIPQLGGAVAVLRKPVTAETLLDRATRLLRIGDGGG
jgi:hypothetical protein